MKTDNKVERPFCLELDDAKREIYDSITEISRKRKIPYYMLEFILNEALVQINIGANREREMAKINYERQLSEVSEEKK